ncbi:MAG TPA: alpha-amylase family protein [Tepidisphaeraceae bacterium]|jgi:hypothetical protein|nr:alpha-amylase family protein [Tepidisphaeraceae bacterium]
MTYEPLDDRRYRQVHLDFHTSEHIADVGAEFDPDAFVATLKLGHVDAINLFAKCHHSWSYYPTEVGQRHPNLVPGLDLLGEQIKACHAAGIRCPIYYTVGWSSNDAADHPDWCVRQQDGSLLANIAAYDLNAAPDKLKPAGGWFFLCPSGEYRRLMLEQTREILETYEVDGLWYDICNFETCWCHNCRAGMKEAGYDAEKVDDAAAYCVDKWESFMKACRDLIAERRPGASVFFNGLVHVVTPPRILAQQTHYELEDLPTVWGGYDKLPPRARFFAGDGKKTIAMSGKFHTAWGEFGGYKHPDALRYEAASMVSFGAMCNFGDQLHPSGRLDEQTYRNVGEAFEYVRTLETWLPDAKPKANLGVLFNAETSNRSVHGTSSSLHDEGLCNMLLESQIDFERVYPDRDLSRFDAIVLPGTRSLTRDTAAALQRFTVAGGRLLVLGEGCLLAGADELALDIGGEYLGHANFQVDYTLAGDALRPLGDLGVGPFLNYTAAPRIKPTDGQVLAAIREPYFDRTYGRYCSHQNTPYVLQDAPHVAAVRKGNVLTLPHSLGLLYAKHGARVHRELATAALKLLGFAPTVTVEGLMSAGRVALYEQASHGRHVLHLTYAVPTPRGRCMVIEDLPTLRDVRVSVKLDGVTSARLPLRGETLQANREGDRLTFTLPRLRMHELVELT